MSLPLLTHLTKLRFYACKLAYGNQGKISYSKIRYNNCWINGINFNKYHLYFRKSILNDVVKYANFTNDRFLECHTRMQKAVDTIRPEEEYKDFIGRHKCVP